MQSLAVHHSQRTNRKATGENLYRIWWIQRGTKERSDKKKVKSGRGKQAVETTRRVRWICELSDSGSFQTVHWDRDKLQNHLNRAREPQSSQFTRTDLRELFSAFKVIYLRDPKESIRTLETWTSNLWRSEALVFVFFLRKVCFQRRWYQTFFQCLPMELIDTVYHVFTFHNHETRAQSITRTSDCWGFKLLKLHLINWISLAKTKRISPIQTPFSTF